LRNAAGTHADVEIHIEDFSGISYGLGIYSDNGAIGHGEIIRASIPRMPFATKIMICCLVNGKLQQTKAAVPVPGRNVFWNAAHAIGLTDS